jgi:hypothetical protein
MTEASGHVYESYELSSGDQSYLGPGAPGKQLDLTTADPRNFRVEKQPEQMYKKVEGTITAFRSGRYGTTNCETEHNTDLANGATSLWIPVRLGEPFRVTLFEEGRLIPEQDYSIEFETTPGLFGTKYDFFRVTNKSGHTWKNIRFLAETTQ